MRISIEWHETSNFVIFHATNTLLILFSRHLQNSFPYGHIFRVEKRVNDEREGENLSLALLHLVFSYGRLGEVAVAQVARRKETSSSSSLLS